MQEESTQSDPETEAPRNKYITIKKVIPIIIFLLFLLLVINFFAVRQDKQEISVIPTPYYEPSTSPVNIEAAYVEDQLIIKYKKDVSEDVIDKHLNRLDALITKRLDAIQRLVIKTPKGRGEIVLKKLQEDNLIENAERDYWNRVNFIPNDPSFNPQWYLVNTGQNILGQTGTVNVDIDADKAWDVTRGGVKVAVLDSGIVSNHPDISSKVEVSKGIYGGGTDDLWGHGTHVAGIIAAITDNNTGIAGVCPSCTIMNVKVMDDYGNGPDSSIIEGMAWAADNGAKVLNMSIGSHASTQAKQDAINYAWNKGVVVVAAAGNGNTSQQFFPCAYANVICVGATDNKDMKASFSNYGNWVDVAAPGVGILATVPTTPYNLQQQLNGGQTSYTAFDGTSQSAPVVAGVAGLVWSSSYGTSAQAVVDRIFNTADKIQGTGTYWTVGRVNAGKAVGASDVTPTLSINPTSEIPTPTSTPPLPNVTQAPTITNPPTVNPTSFYISPTLYCLGAPCPDNVLPTIPNIPPATSAPSSQPQNTPTSAMSQVPVSPTSIIIQEPTQPESSAKPKKKKSFMEKIIELIMMLLKWFQNLFKGYF